MNTAAILDGLGSLDVDGHSLTYAWVLTEQPVGSLAMLVDPGASMPSLTPDIPGDYTLELVVNDGFVDSEATEESAVTVTATSAGDFAQGKVSDAMGFLRSLPNSAFDRRGHKRALLRQVRKVQRELNQGHVWHAAFRLYYLVLPRVDGVSLRGSVDPKGWCQPNRPDWLVDETAQVEVYDCLKAAHDALCQ